MSFDKKDGLLPQRAEALVDREKPLDKGETMKPIVPVLPTFSKDPTKNAHRPDSSSGEPSMGSQVDKLRETSAEFESIFIRQILKDMRRTLSEGGFFGHGLRGEIYTSFIDEQLALSLAKGRGIGLGERLYQQLSARFKEEMGG